MNILLLYYISIHTILITLISSYNINYLFLFNDLKYNKNIVMKVRVIILIFLLFTNI